MLDIFTTSDTMCPSSFLLSNDCVKLTIHRTHNHNGDRTDPGIYRPISVLPALSKSFELIDWVKLIIPSARYRLYMTRTCHGYEYIVAPPPPPPPPAAQHSWATNDMKFTD